MRKEKYCCQIPGREQKKGFCSGLFYGLIPHSFCIFFIILSIVGATTATVFLKRLLIFPYFFQILIVFSVFFATLSAIFYLKRLGFLSWGGIKKKWRYLLTLYGVTILINLLFFFVIFPYSANINYEKNKTTVLSQQINLSSITLTVDIPCPGHALLVIDELKKVSGIKNVFFQYPNTFRVNYNSMEVSPEKILQAEIFESFKATIDASYK